MQRAGYPEVQLPSWTNARLAFQDPQEEMLDHGCAQAQDVAREYP
jgi:hypothetical protein